MPGRTGRPPEDDAAHLQRMADLLTGGLARSCNAAATTVAAEAFPGAANLDSVVERLRRKYRKDRVSLEADAEERRNPKPLEFETIRLKSKLDLWGLKTYLSRVKKPEK